MKHLITLFIILSAQTSNANGPDVLGQIIAQKDGSLVLVSDFEPEKPENNFLESSSTKKNEVKLKAILLESSKSILVLDISNLQTESQPAKATQFALNRSNEILPIQLAEDKKSILVEVSTDGQVWTKNTITEEKKQVGFLKSTDGEGQPDEVFMSISGDLVTSSGVKLGVVTDATGAAVQLLTDSNLEIATFLGTGSEVVLSGQDAKFMNLANFLQKAVLNQSMSDVILLMKVSMLGSVAQISAQYSSNDAYDAVFRFISPVVVNQVKQMQKK